MNENKKIKITEDALLLMEKASRLNVRTGLEKRILIDRMSAIDQYSRKAVISLNQLKVIKEMAERYDRATLHLTPEILCFGQEVCVLDLEGSDKPCEDCPFDEEKSSDTAD